ncbi:hypothetical protein [Streptomyces sp. CL12-4]|uniref:hypothetical protein n=1 Tax=Streptomyces sp. CL12-4 TaxID=2810306 RepID=UPI001EFBB11B|nr:hypothetical protein [Streptomyces sp. CL12-4]MCG8971756.1 hypothetical protein [Streptomyces sp. CL12-4]
MELNRQELLDRLNEGEAAFEQGDPSDACPYDRYGDAEQQFGYRYWNKGWHRARGAAESGSENPAATSAGQ